jgi:hypothetical protein
VIKGIIKSFRGSIEDNLPIAVYFTAKELACSCCGQIYITDEFEKLITSVREYFDKPMIVHRCYSCLEHNEKIHNSTKNSFHTQGCAMDFHVQDISIIEAYKKLIKFNPEGLLRIGLYKSHIHIDCGMSDPALWWVIKDQYIYITHIFE